MYPSYIPRVLIFDNLGTPSEWGIYLIEPESSSPEWEAVENRLLDENRADGSGVILPDGTVLFVGGTTAASQLNTSGHVLTPEIFNPFDAQNRWALGAPLQRFRGYHSVAILMFDGRVFIGGGEPKSESLHDYELYTPDCLLRGPRPEFSVSAERISHGQTLSVRLSGDWAFKHLHAERIALIKCCTATHAFNYDQRYVNLFPNKKLRRYADRHGEGYRLQEDYYRRIETLQNAPFELPELDDKEFDVIIPQNPNLLPPGYYYLFLLSKIGGGSLVLLRLGN